MNTSPATQTPSFTDRLAAARAADKEFSIKRSTAALNGQVSQENEESSSWNNFNQYFKFASISR